CSWPRRRGASATRCSARRAPSGRAARPGSVFARRRGGRGRGRARAPARRRRWRVRLVRWGLAAAALAALATALPVLALRAVPPLTTAFMARRALGLDGGGRCPRVEYRWVDWEHIS